MAATWYVLYFARETEHIEGRKSAWALKLRSTRGMCPHFGLDSLRGSSDILLVVLFLLLFWFVAGSWSFVLFVGFACLFLWFVLCFWFSCWDCILDCVQVHYQYFCGYRQLTAFRDNLNSSFATIEHV